MESIQEVKEKIIESLEDKGKYVCVNCGKGIEETPQQKFRVFCRLCHNQYYKK